MSIRCACDVRHSPRLIVLTGGPSAARRLFSSSYVQIELQRMAIEDGHSAVIVCDRGTLDGLAYWPREPALYFEELGTTKLRPESAEQAAAINARISQAWAGHPRTFTIPSDANLVAKIERGIELIRAELPPCCR